jgi:hypothetical protein
MTEYERLGITPTADDGKRTGAEVPWDESSRPRRPESGPDVEYSQHELGEPLAQLGFYAGQV